MVDFDDLQRILDLIRSHDLREFELDAEGFRLRVRRDGGIPATPAQVVEARPDAAIAPVASPSAAPGPAAPTGAGAREVVTPAAVPGGDEAGLVVVTSPIVGTFYRAPEPGAKPFVEVGQRVNAGHVLCIIEAMKLMNEIESEVSGELVGVFAENAQPVQFGDRLFAIRPR